MARTNAPVTHRRCRCSSCGEVFSALSNFDRHRQDRRCKNPESVGMEIKEGPNGTWWGLPSRESGPGEQ